MMGGDRHHHSTSSSDNGNFVVDIYPLDRYYFGSKDAVPDKEETWADRTRRMKSNFAANGPRTSVGGVILVELYKRPHMLLLQVRNSFFKLPGGRLRPGEPDIEGLKRKMSSRLSVDNISIDWQVGDCLGMWWRADFDTLPFPFLPSNERKPKECIKVFLVRLPMTQHFYVPKNMKLLAVPLSRIHKNSETYGHVISEIPDLLSTFSFNVIQD